MKPEVSSSTSKPPSIGWATTLLWMTVIIGGIAVILDWPELTRANSADYVAFLYLITFALWCFLIRKIGQGKNWARIVYLVLLVIAALKFSPAVSEFYEHPLLILIGFGGLAIQAIAMILIFTGPGKQWFPPPQKAQ